MKRWIITLLVTTLLLFVMPLAVYAGLHFVGTTSFGFGSLRASADISGFGNNTDSVVVTLSAVGNNLTAMCQNKGGNRAPGQNPVSVSVNTSQTVAPKKNGTAVVNFHVNLLPTADAAGCPNRNWTVTDLYGTLNVTLNAVDTATGAQASQSFVCVVDEAHRQVTCS
jgi:hypothetical protein